MSSTRRSLPPRVRSQPQRLAHEQEDERLHADEAAELLRAMRLSIHPESGSETDTDSDSDSEEASDLEEDEVDEEALISSLDEKVREKYDEVVEDEEKRGWTTYSPITVKPFVTAPMTVPVLNGCTTPLDFFHALLPSPSSTTSLSAPTPTQRTDTLSARRTPLHLCPQPKLAEGEVQHIPQLRRERGACVVCSKTVRGSHGKHKPRTREGCETCGVAVHIACWKDHLPRGEDGVEE